MSWQDRLGETIDFISPSGREFSALWRGNDRSKGKKLGSFSPPKRKGTIYQDLDVDSVKYPLTFIFDGDNHDLISRLFFETCSENGQWKITHPTYGVLNLQLVSVLEKNQPITDGNYTEFETEWVEPLKEDEIASSAELASQIERQIETLNISSAGQLESLADQSLASRIQALKDAAGSAVSSINSGLESLSELSADIARITNEIQRATTTNLANPLVAIDSLASQIQIASQTPALASDNITERTSSYTSLLSTFSEIAPSDPTPENKNTIAIKEISMVSLLATLPLIATTGPLSTRQEAISLAESFANQFDLLTQSLDANQETYSNNLLENQYFSQSESYSDLEKLISLGIRYLLVSSFDLKIEKRFVIDSPRTPIDLTISEYGGLGDNDENLDLFISSNNLKNTKILLLPAGTEVVVYV